MKETILLFNISQKKYSKILRAALPLKLRIKNIPKADFSKTMGQLVGISDVSSTTIYDGDGISEEMMLLCGFSNELMDRLFFALKKSGAGLIKLTAVLTETNMYWDTPTLFAELKKEREQMIELKTQKEQKNN